MCRASSVLWLHIVTFKACVSCTVLEYTGYTLYPHTVHDAHALQVTICSHNTDYALHIFYVSTFNQACNF